LIARVAKKIELSQNGGFVVSNDSSQLVGSEVTKNRDLVASRLVDASTRIDDMCCEGGVRRPYADNRFFRLFLLWPTPTAALYYSYCFAVTCGKYKMYV